MKSIYLIILSFFIVSCGSTSSSSGNNKFAVSSSSNSHTVVIGMKKDVQLKSNREGSEFAVSSNPNNSIIEINKISGELIYRSSTVGLIDRVAVEAIEKDGKKSDPLTLTFKTVSDDIQPTRKILKTGADDGGFGESRSFTKNEAGDIVDSFGFVWAGKSDKKIDEAKSYISSENKCFVLKAINENSNWRLPTSDGVLNLIDYSKVSGKSMLDPLFGDHNLTYTWIDSDMQNAKIISFDNALIANVSLFDKQQKYTSRCVNAPIDSSDHIVSTDRGNEITYDFSTGLSWSPINEQRRVIDDANQTAAQYCAEFQNSSGWRLPNINEYRSIVEDGIVSNFITNGTTVLISATPFNDSNLTAKKANYAMYLIEDGSVGFGAQFADELYGITCVKSRF